ncbi:hypothetical protein [Edaphobacter dinghuensis]|uniref:Uncharacterized protein n=1 Tax=Edaphobacter dinghuensis TaxID=1560005 RepID=A0A917HFW9_9BACT|nr:hypothetical protein [Edaphobacter dinghuensis]GGG78357.1 hypothetical protein GCM10011585_21890 [Edaphobacter dinghuensis]
MRLPFPEKIPLQYAVAFAALIAVIQLIQGTDPAFSLCFFLFVVITAVTFNLAGGLTRPSGGYVFFYSVLAVIAGVCWKVVMGEPADSNLTQPLLTMEAILGGMVSMCLAVLVSRRFRRKIPILPALTNERLLQASIGSLITGLIIEAIILFVPHESGSALGALTQLNGFLPLAMILGVIYEIRRSGGTRSINIPVLISGFTIFFIGVIGFSKQGMFTPLLCWAVAAASQRYRLAPYKLLLFMGFVVFTGYYLAPYSQYGRNSKVYATTAADPESGPPLSPMGAFLQNIDTSFSLLTQLEHVRQLDKQVEVPMRVEGMPAYYNTEQGMFDRLQMIAVDDAIINVTEQRGAFGPAPIFWSFENLVPHFLWPGKPELKLGNMYAHEIGMLDPDDTTTGISFSPIGEGFHLLRWTSIFLILPLLWIALFILFDSLCGDIRTSPWGLLALVIFGHLAPEGGMNGVIYMLWFGAINVSLAALAAVYVMPLLGYIATGSRETRSRRNVAVRSIARRPPVIQSSENASL